MSRTELREFEERLNSADCTQGIRDVVSALREAADRSGTVDWSAHSARLRSWGIVGRRDGRVLCRLDMKPQAGHVCVCIPGADDSKLTVAGTVHTRKNAPSWVDIRDTRGARLLEPLFAATSAPGGGIAKRVAERSSGSSSAALRGTSASQDPTQPGGSIATDDRSIQPGVESASPSGNIRDELRGHGFARVGLIRPAASGKSCELVLGPTAPQGRAVYALVVGEQLTKCGDTGRKAATLHKRMTDCVRTINDRLSGALPGPFTENFKNLAPLAVAANIEIEIWAMRATESECEWFQRHLNEKHETIRVGWANRLQ